MSELLNAFQAFRLVLCVCPCCGEIIRVSDLHLHYTGKVAKTWLDNYELNLNTLVDKEKDFEEKEKILREKSIDRGRAKVPAIIKRCLCEDFKQLDYDPYDIKAVMDPVDFVVFDGLNKGKEVRSVTFLTRTPSTIMQPVIDSLKKAIDGTKYDWKVARISITGKVEFE